MKSRKKHIAAAAAGAVILFLTPLIVYAFILKSAEKVNQFRPAKQDILIAENQNNPAETQDNEIKWSVTTNTSGNHVAVKEVSVNEISNPNGEYLRVRLVPAWYDSSGCIVSVIEDVTDICSAVIEDNKLLFKDSGGENTVVTVNLAENWNEKWETVPNNTNVQYFKSKVPIKKDDKEIELMSSVEISDTILSSAQTNNITLHLDVLTDSIQDNVNPKWQ
ncbi:MAG: hypothetical protein K5898_02730 [Ruminococcus sp.]|uniref:hypothetical protein n=1 Tax=Ruminococcus sp. TaxID=41978 RepID=UPI0025F0EA97|nr:hypothetical protein [Ruminococcus sp.]MCR4794084.1 hypothetical protein [Ruminococcus sp.]